MSEKAYARVGLRPELSRTASARRRHLPAVQAGAWPDSLKAVPQEEEGEGSPQREEGGGSPW